MKRTLAALAVGAALLGGAAGAAGHSASVPAAVTITGSEAAAGSRVTVRAVLATAPRCRADRAVDVFARYGEWTHRHVWAPGPWERVGTLHPGADGSLAATVQAPALWAVKFKVPPVDRGRRGHRHVCEGATGGLRFDPAVTNG